MGSKVIAVEEWSSARPEDVFAVLADGESWPRWSPLGSYERERDGDTEREGVGAIRHFTTNGMHSHERVVVFDPPRHFAYELVAGLPLKGYRADVRLEPRRDGTAISWRSEFDPKIPGTGWFFRAFLSRFITQVVRDLARHTSELATKA